MRSANSWNKGKSIVLLYVENKQFVDRKILGKKVSLSFTFGRKSAIVRSAIFGEKVIL